MDVKLEVAKDAATEVAKALEWKKVIKPDDHREGYLNAVGTSELGLVEIPHGDVLATYRVVVAMSILPE
jgi:hypothetical protein